MKITMLLISLIVSNLCCAQHEVDIVKKKFAWTFHSHNTVINGISVGLFSHYGLKRNVVSNGVRLEVPGIGLISFMGNGFPNAKDSLTYADRIHSNLSEVVNGLNISSGSWGNIKYNGITIGAVGQFGIYGNGLVVAGGWNLIDRLKGVEISFIVNSSYYFKGVQLSAFNTAVEGHGIQIGLFNKSKHLKGIQIGLWNTSEKRRLPIINWG